MGANDGASGVAVLLELARILAENPAPIGVNLVFFDAEDLGSPGLNETSVSYTHLTLPTNREV